MNITEEFRKIFAGEQKTSDEEQDVLLDTMTFMRDDVEMGMNNDVIHTWRLKIQGAIEYLEAVGKISGEQSKRLFEMLSEIESVTYE